MKTSLTPSPRRGLAVATLALLTACGGGGGGGGGQGELRMALTDAPACGFDEVNVTISQVRVHKSSTAADGDDGWSQITLEPARRVNLLDLTNGVLEELGTTTLPAGKYTQLRLVLAENDAANPLANAVTPTGGTEVALDTPSAQQSGLKLKANIDVAADQTADFVLDFDACKSVVSRGNSGGYNLKPVVSILPRVSAPGLAVEGYVAEALGGVAAVSLQQDGAPVRATVADKDTGRFLLSPVPEGNYTLVVSAEGRVTAVMTGVPVTAGALTQVNPQTSRIDPPASAMRSASGAVTTTASSVIPEAIVRALQSVGTTTFERAARPVDADTGAYTYSLPAGAPVRAAYVAGAGSVTFTADSAAAGKYTLEALVPDHTTQSADIDLSTADAVHSFSFAP